MSIDAVVDLSHFNGPDLDLAYARASGLMGVVHKATQGLSYVDPTLHVHLAQARAAGLLTGVYHFGVGGDGAAQARYFLEQAQAGDLLALDLEANPEGTNMSAAEAVTFVTACQAATGVTPLLYGGSYLKALVTPACPPELAACPLWLAQYGPQAVLPNGWATWSLWQYTDGHANAPAHPWAGIGACDRDRFNGDVAELQAFWAAHAA
jgi:lysozyme